MIKLQDFAREQGVTDRAIQKHLKKYATELEGMVERKGPNGTWLTEEACEILRSKMKQQPVVFFDEDPRLAKLEAEKAELQRQLNAVNEDFRKYAANTSVMLSKAAEQLQLAERATEYKNQVKNLESELEREKDVAITLSQKVDEVEKALEAAEKEKQTLAAVAEANGQEVEREKAAKEAAEEKAERANAEAEELRRELEAIKALPWWRKIFIQKKK